MQMKKNLFEIMLVVLLIGVSVGFAYYYGTQKERERLASTLITKSPKVDEVIPTKVSTPSVVVTPATTPTTILPNDWETYTNQKYGFEISFPKKYKVLTDKESLYGWPKAIALICGGGQSYDLPIEYWTTEAEYQKKYQGYKNMTVKKIDDFYITLVNVNFDSTVDEIIKTFKEI